MSYVKIIIRSFSLLILSTAVFSEVYDGTQYQSKPNLSSFGILDVEIIYAQELWPNRIKGDGVPTESYIYERLKDIDCRKPVVLDIEHWPLLGYFDDRDLVRESVDKYIETIKIFKKIKPICRFGYFGLFPVSNIAYIMSTEPRITKNFEMVNRELERLYPFVDILFPSVYTINKDYSFWKRSLDRTLNLAYNTKNKKVYVFLWPQFYDRNPTPVNLRLKYLEPKMWGRQLRDVYSGADGMVLWGGWDFDDRKPLYWDEEALWWVETKLFLSELSNTRGPNPPIVTVD